MGASGRAGSRSPGARTLRSRLAGNEAGGPEGWSGFQSNRADRGLHRQSAFKKSAMVGKVSNRGRTVSRPRSGGHSPTQRARPPTLSASAKAWTVRRSPRPASSDIRPRQLLSPAPGAVLRQGVLRDLLRTTAVWFEKVPLSAGEDHLDGGCCNRRS